MENEFHIHVDAEEISEQFRTELISGWGFCESDFAGHPDGAEGFEPPHHLTRKTQSGKEFQRIFDTVRDFAANPGAMKGYIEGEYVPSDEDFQETPFDPSVAPPQIRLSLEAVPPGLFRESEVHIVMDADRSDPRLISYLRAIGLFSAYMNKPYGRAVIFTAGGSRRDIASLLDSLRLYLSLAGGSIKGSIKEERIINYWLSDSGLRLPPVVSAIHWHT